MKKIALGVLVVALSAAGCATVNHVNVNGYLNKAEFQNKVAPPASFFVLTRKNSRNPIFDSEVKMQIENLLRQKGYRIAAYEKAGFLADFTFSMSPGRVVIDYQPVYHFGDIGTVVTQTPHGKVVVSQIQYPGYTTYAPWQREEYTASLTFGVLAAEPYRSSKAKKYQWIGEAANTSEDRDIRRAVPYLLTALSRHFMEDTHASVVTDIRGKDPEVENLSREALAGAESR